MKKFNKQLANLLLSAALLIVSIFGVLKVNEVVGSAAEEGSVEIPGGTNSKGEEYSSFKFEKNSPEKDGYADSNESSPTIKNARGSYFQAAAQNTKLQTKIFEGNDHSIFTSFQTGDSYYRSDVVKVNQNGRIIATTKAKDPSNSGYAKSQVLGYSGENKLLIGTLGRKMYRYSDVDLSLIDESDKQSSFVPYGHQYFFGSYNQNVLGIGTKSWTANYSFSAFGEIDISSGDAKGGFVGKAGYPPELTRPAEFFVRDYVRIHGNKYLIVIQSKATKGIVLFLYDHSPLINNPKAEKGETKLLEAHNVNNFYGRSYAFSNIYIDNKDILIYDRIQKELEFRDLDDGNLSKSVPFAVEDFDAVKFLDASQLPGSPRDSQFALIGMAKGKGKFAPFSKGDSEKRNLIITFFNDKAELISGTFLGTELYENANIVLEDALTINDGKSLGVAGSTDGTDRSLFQNNYEDIYVKSTQKKVGMIGLFDYLLDYSPKLPVRNSQTIRLNDNDTENSMDDKMLLYIKENMQNGSEDIEANKLDDYTDNAVLLNRINKNVYNTEYEEEPVDWELFGLEKIVDPISGSQVYKPGHYEVTYGVTDDVLNQTVTSVPTNIVNDNTITDDDQNLDAASAALQAQNYRVSVEDGNLLEDAFILDAEHANAFGWNMETGDKDAQDKIVVSDKSMLKKEPGVYPVTISSTVSGLEKTIYVTVYDASMVSGPEHMATDEEKNPSNLQNSELLRAIDNEFSLFDAKTLYSNSAQKMVQARAWYANPADANSIAITPVYVDTIQKIKDEDGQAINPPEVITHTSGEFEPSVGEFMVSLSTKAGPGGTTKNATIRILADKQPVLDAKDYVLLEKDSLTPTRQDVLKDEIIKLSGDESLKKSDIVIKDKNGSIIADDPSATDINTAEPGIYTLYYSIQNGAGLGDTAFVHFVVGMDILDDRYALTAHHFDVAKKDVTYTNNNQRDNQIRSLSGAKGYDLRDPNALSVVPVVSNSGGYGPKVGPYEITLKIADATASKKIVANVYEYADPSELENKYIIDMKKEETMRVQEAQAYLQAGKKVIDSEFLGVVAWEKNTTNIISLQEPQNYATPNALKSPEAVVPNNDGYDVTVTVGSDANTVSKVGKIIIQKEGDPSLRATEIITIPKGTNPATIDILEEVESKDGNKNEPNPPITTTLKLANGEVVNSVISDATQFDTSKDGVYQVIYNIVDSQNLTAEATRYYVIGNNPVVDKKGDRVLFADNYVVDTMQADGTQGVRPKDYTKDPQRIAQASLYELSTTKRLQDKIYIDAASNVNGYADGSAYTYTIDGKQDTYHKVGAFPLTFTVTSGGVTLRKPIIASVVGPTTAHNEAVAIDLHDAVLRRSEVSGRKARNITDIQVWNLQTGDTLVENTEYIVETDGFDSITNPKEFAYKRYEVKVTEHVSQDELSHAKGITIIPGGAPSIEYSEAVNRENGSIALTLDEIQNLDEIGSAPHIKGAWDFEDTGGAANFYPKKRISLVSSGGFDKTKVGTYVVKYEVTDDDFNTTTKTLTYLVGANNTSATDAIYANHITVQQKDLQQASDLDSFIKKQSQLHADAFIFNDDGIITETQPIAISDIAADLGELSSDSPIGGYPVTFTTPDGTTAQIVVNVVDKTTNIDGIIYISAANGSIFVGEITPQKTAEVLTNVRAWNSQTGAHITTTNGLVTQTQYTTNINKPIADDLRYSVSFSTPSLDSKSKKEVSILVKKGGTPSIKVTPKVEFIPLDGEVQTPILEGITTHDAEEGDSLSFTADAKTIDTSKKGVTTVTYAVVDRDGNHNTATRSYVIGSRNPEEGDTIAIFANNFFVSKSEISKNEGSLDTLVQQKSQYFAQLIGTAAPITDIKIDMPQAFKNGTVGPHDITITAKADNKTKSIIIKGIVYDMGEVVEDKIVIEASDATIRLGEIKETGLADAFRHLNAAYPISAWTIDGDKVDVAATNSMPQFAKATGVYEITLTAKDTSIKRNLTVQSVSGPVLHNDTPSVHIDSLEAIAVGDLLQGISVQNNHPDTEWMMENLKGILQKDINILQKTKDGVYVVTYIVTDKDGNVSNTVTRRYIVGDPTVNKDGAVYGENKTIAVQEVTGVDADGHQDENISAILAKMTSAKGYDMDADVQTSIVKKQPLQLAVTSPTYKKQIGGYPTSIAIEDASFTGKTPIKNVVINVLDNVDGKGEAKEFYAVQGFNRTYRPSSANGRPLTELVGAKGWSTQTGDVQQVTVTATNSKGQTISPNDWLTTWPEEDVYTVNLQVGAGKDAVMVSVLLTIDNGNKPNINIPEYTTLVDLGSEPIDPKSDVSADDLEDLDLSIDDVVVSGDTINTKEKGVYVITYRVVDSDKNETVVRRSYIVRDKQEDGVGEKYAIFATNFVKHKKDVKTSPTQVLIDAKVKVQEIATGKVMSQSEMLELSMKFGGYGPTAGKYVMEFALSSDAQAKIIASVIEDDIKLPSYDDTVVISGINYRNRPDTVRNTPVVNVVQAMAWDRKTGEDYTNKLAFEWVDGTSYNIEEPTQGKYKVSLQLDPALGKKFTSVPRSIELISGNKPTITLTQGTEIVAVEKGANVDVYADVKAEDMEDGIFSAGEIGAVDKVAKKYYANVAVDTTEIGVQKVTYTAFDNDGNQAAEKTRIYVIGALANNNEYAIFGKNFHEKAEQMQAEDASIIAKAEGHSIRFSDGKQQPAVIPFEGAKDYQEMATRPLEKRVAGSYPIRLQVADNPNVEAIVYANVLKYGVPDDQANYYIDAKNVQILKSKVGNQTAEMLTEVQAWNPITGAAITIDKENGAGEQLVKEEKPEFIAEIGTYQITYNIVKKGRVQKSIDVSIRVDGGDDPVITLAPSVQHVPLGTDIRTIDFFSGVSANDKQDGTYGNGGYNTVSKEKQKIYADGNVDTNKSGTYIVHYTVTDSDDNQAKEVVRSYVVDGTIGDTYAIFGDDFVVLKDQVDMQHTEKQILEKSNAIAHKWSKPDSTSDVLVENSGGYTNEIGAYHVKLQVADEPETIRPIVASVHEGIIDGEYVMSAHNGKVRPSQINSRTVETVTGSKAWNKHTGEKVEYKNIVKNAEGDIVTFDKFQPVGTYTVEYSINGKVLLTRTIEVISGTAPEILYTDSVEEDGTVVLTLADAKALDVATLPHIKGSWDVEDTGSIDHLYTPNRVQLINDGGIDTTKPGIYHVTYQVEDDDKNVSSRIVTYIIGSQSVLNDDVIFSQNATVLKKELQQVSNIEQFAKEKTEVSAKHLIKDASGLVLRTEEIKLFDILFNNTDALASSSGVGGYKVTFATRGGEATAESIINVVDENTSVDGPVYIYAENITRRPSKLTSIDTPSRLNKVRAWNSTTGLPVIEPELITSTEYSFEKITLPMDKQLTPFDVVYTIAGDTKSKKKDTITVDNGERPDIAVSHSTLQLPVGSTAPNILNNATITDVEDDDEGLPVALQVQPDNIDMDKKGVTRVTYSGSDSDGNTATSKFASYVVGANDPKPEDEIAIFAENFAINQAELFASPSKDLMIKEKAKALAKKIVDGSNVEVTVADAQSFKTGAIGPHPIILQAGNKKVTIVGSVYANGDLVGDTVIEAKDRTIRLGDVPEKPTLGTAYDILNTDPEDAQYEILAWKLDGTMLPVTATKSTPTFAKEMGSYAVELTAGEQSISRSIHVIKAESPFLQVAPQTSYIHVGGTVSIDDIMQGVTISHVDAKSLLEDLKNELRPMAQHIDTRVPNVYVVTYSVTDKDGNTSNVVSRSYVIGEATDTADAAIFGEGATLELNEVEGVDENGVQDAELSNILTRLTQAQGFDKKPDTTTSIIKKDPLAINASSPTYKKATGGYPVALTIQDDQFNGISPTRNVMLQVVDNTNGSGSVGDKYAVQGFDKTYRPSVANGKSLLQLVEAQGWDVTNGGKVPVSAHAKNADGVEMTDAQWMSAWPEDGGYTVTLTVGSGSFKQTVQVDLTIDKGEAPRISFDKDIVEVDLYGESPRVKNGMNVSDDFDVVSNEDVKVTQEAVDTSTKGVTIVHYTITDSDRNITTATRSYVVRDEQEDGIGKTRAVFATNFVKHKKDVTGTDREAIAYAQVKVQDIATGEVLQPIQDAVRTDAGGYTNIAGLYKMIFTAKDDKSAKANIIASVIDDSVPMPGIDDEIVITGTNFIGLPQEAKDISLSKLVNAQAWDRKTGDLYNEDLEVVFIGEGYDVSNPVQGSYQANISLTGVTVPFTDVSRQIELRSGEKPIINFVGDTEVVAVEMGTTVDVYQDVIASDAEDGPFKNGTLGTVEKVADTLYASAGIDTSKSGIQKVTYSGFDVDGNDAKMITRYYVVGAKASNKQYAIFANNFHEKVEDMSAKDEDIIEKAKAYALNVRSGEPATVAISFDGASSYQQMANKPLGERLAGTHPISLQVVDDASIATTVHANVIKYGIPNEQASYYIDAKNVEILKSHIGSQKAQDLTEVVAWNATTGREITLDQPNADGELLVKKEKPVFVAEVGTYNITYHVVQNGQSKQDVNVVIEVIAGSAPILTVHPEAMKVPLNTANKDVDFFYGVKGEDAEDGEYLDGGYNVAKQEKMKVYAEGQLNTREHGTYLVSYNVTDSDDNKAKTKIRSMVVDGDFGDAYAIYGNGFTINIEDVAKTPAEQIEQLLEQSHAKSELLVDPLQKGTVSVVNTGGYTDAVGSYTVQLQVEEEPETTRTIRVNVHEGTEGETDIMSAHDGVIRPSQITSNTVREITDSAAWDKATGKPIHFTTTVVNEKGEEVTFTGFMPLGRYTVTFTTEKNTTLKRVIEVVPGEAPHISIENPIIEVDKETRGTIDYLDGVSASDKEDTGNLNYPIDRIQVDGIVNIEKQGRYEITYRVTDDDRNVTESKRVYLVSPSKWNEQIVLFSQNFQVRDVDVAKTEIEKQTQVLRLGEVVAYQTISGKQQNVKVTDLGGYTNKEGIYTASLDATNNVTGVLTIEVLDTIAPDAPAINHIEEGDSPIISGTAEQNTIVDVTLPDGTVINGIPVDDNGVWEVTSPHPLHDGDTIVATNTDGSGNTSEETSREVKDTMYPERPIIDPMKEGARVITGTGTPSLVVEVTLPNGTKITTTVDENGEWTVPVPEDVYLKGEEIVTAIQIKPSGNKSETAETIVITIPQPLPPTIQPILEGDSTVTGTGEPGNTIEVVFPDGVREQATVQEDGTWSVKVPTGTYLKTGETVKATQQNPDGKTSNPVKEIVRNNFTYEITGHDIIIPVEKFNTLKQHGQLKSYIKETAEITAMQLPTNKIVEPVELDINNLLTGSLELNKKYTVIAQYKVEKALLDKDSTNTPSKKSEAADAYETVTKAVGVTIVPTARGALPTTGEYGLEIAVASILLLAGGLYMIVWVCRRHTRTTKLNITRR